MLNVLMQKERKSSYSETELMKYTDTSRVYVRIVLRVREKSPEDEVLLDCWIRTTKKASLTTEFGSKE
jgi:hypothetical protein